MTKNMKKYYKVGTIIKFDGTLLLVEETPNNEYTCTKCFFSKAVREKKGKCDYSCYVHGLACTVHYRKDRKNVIFREVKIVKVS